MWPWATYQTLRIFWLSMRRARINSTHVLRCVGYSFDFAFPAGLALVASGTGVLLANQRSLPGWAAGGLLLLVILGPLWGMARLYAAYKLYLRFEHPFMVVLASQVIVGLLAANLVLGVRLSGY
jgi:hypothetical protein